MEQLKKNFVPALLSAVIICFLKVFTLPWEIWTGTVIRLAKIRQDPLKDTLEDSEFPVLFWVKAAFDGLLFLAYPFVLLFMIVGLFNSGPSALWLYFVPIPYSIIKEFMTLGLSIALNLEKIAHTN